MPQRRPRRPCAALFIVRSSADRLQLVPQPALPEVPERRRAALARSAARRSIARAVLPRGVHFAGAHQRHRLHQQGGPLWTVVRHCCRDAAHDRRRSKALGCPDRHHPGATHLGFGADSSSARARHRTGRRACARCRPVGAVQARVLPLRAGPVAPLPAPLPRRTAEPASSRATEVLR